jgi:glutaredoxin
MLFARPFAVLGLTWFVSFAGLLAPFDAAAQQIYRFVGPDGRITFSDRPPAEPGARAGSAAGPAVSSGSDTAALPFELRQAAQAYPVTLFSGPECGPCEQGRSMLRSRGIPFSEKTVSTNEDIESLKRLAGVATLPVLTIGGQQLKGYSQFEWTQFLDAAGYPSTSQLPAGYRAPAATPLVAVQDVKQPARQAAAPVEAPEPAAPPPPPANGFQF